MKIDLPARGRHESSSVYIFRLLKSNIVTLRLPPGSGLSEKEIADLLAVSRTPVREAFIKLTQEALLEVMPQRGTYVSLIDVEQVEEARFLRENIEKEVIKIACNGSFPAEGLMLLESHLKLQEKCMQLEDFPRLFELDDAMHGIIFAACRKGRIWAAIQQMNNHYNRVRMLNLAYGHDWPLILEQHRHIVACIAAGDAAQGALAVDIHLKKVICDLHELTRDFAHFFRRPAAGPATG